MASLGARQSHRAGRRSSPGVMADQRRLRHLTLLAVSTRTVKVPGGWRRSPDGGVASSRRPHPCVQSSKGSLSVWQCTAASTFSMSQSVPSVRRAERIMHEHAPGAGLDMELIGLRWSGL